MVGELAQHFDAFGAAAAGALLGSLSAFGLGLIKQRHDRRKAPWRVIGSSICADVSMERAREC